MAYIGRQFQDAVPADGTVTKAKVSSGDFVTDFTDTVITASDEIIFADATDTQAEKKDTVQGILDLVPAPATATLGTPHATTSGTTFTTHSGIPSGTKLVFITLSGVSGSGIQNMTLRLGDSGGLEASGYVSTGGKIDITTPSINSDTIGFRIRMDTSAQTYDGVITLVLANSSTNTWVATHNVKGNTDELNWGSGIKSLSGELTQIGLHLAGGETYDAGALNIVYI